ncbi:MAG: hypothetical protein KatS3mg082_0597 [Nitrospiraceae bacterium]|nr:MAG: hypothetical protein KatS3mg082_0597 [Nitrospiraceae bacterium]
MRRPAGFKPLRNWADPDAFKRAVYPSPDYIASLSTSTPIAEHVRVDLELWGCPIDKGQLLSVLIDLLAGVQPRLPAHSVCLECKRRGIVCVMVAKGVPCLGPVTRTGCGAICPSMGTRLLRLLRTGRRRVQRTRPSAEHGVLGAAIPRRTAAHSHRSRTTFPGDQRLCQAIPR